MFRFRRLILKLTVAAGIIPLLFWIFVALVPVIGPMLGPSRSLGSRFFVRYISEYDDLKVYRDGYPLIEIDRSRTQVAGCIALYGLFSLVVASVEGFVRLIERGKRRAGGFEVITPQTTHGTGNPVAPLPPESAG